MKLALDKRYQRKDGTHPIVFRLSYMGKSRDISTGFTCKLSDWDSRYGNLKVTTQELKTTDDRLKEQRFKYQEKLLEFERNLMNASTTIQDIKLYLSSSVSVSTTVCQYWKKEIDLLKRTRRFGNARSYEGVLTAVLMSKSLDIPFKRLNIKWILELDADLKSRGLKPNSVAVYMRTIRALYNKAINEGIADKEDYPFDKYRIKAGKTAPRVISIDELNRYFNLNVPPNSIRFDHWNYGKLIFMLRGINFTDLALLTRDNIKQDRIVYKRSKTHKLYSVKIVPEIHELIQLYHDPDRQTLFPIMSKEDYFHDNKYPQRIGQLRKTTNKWLRKLGVEAHIEENLSTYVFRYSYANACKRLGFSKDLIAEALGHEYGNTVTGVYLEQFDMEVVDEMNEIVINKIWGD